VRVFRRSPAGFSVGTTTTAPPTVAGDSASTKSCATARPVASSPWIDPVTHSVGPSRSPFTTATGSRSLGPVGRSVTASAPRPTSPGAAVTDPTVISLMIVLRRRHASTPRLVYLRPPPSGRMTLANRTRSRARPDRLAGAAPSIEPYLSLALARTTHISVEGR
jgi:hypothetical protein